MRKTNQILYFQVPNVISLSEKLDSSRLLNIGKTTLDTSDNLKRMYPINADKLKSNAWNLIGYFEISKSFENKANEFFKTELKDMDKPFHNYIKANSSDWLWVDPNEFEEINQSTEVFRYIGPKEMATAINDLIEELKLYQNRIIKGKDVFQSNIYDDSKKNICSREMITKIAQLSANFTKLGIVTGGDCICSENITQNLIHAKSVWFNNLQNQKKFVKLVVDVNNGNLYLYLKQPSNKVFNALLKEFTELENMKHAEKSGISYILIGNLIANCAENYVEELSHKIDELLKFIRNE